MGAWRLNVWKLNAWKPNSWVVDVVPIIVSLPYGTSVLAVDTTYLLPNTNVWISAFVASSTLQSSLDNIKWTNIVLDKNKEARVVSKYIRTRNNSSVVSIRNKKH